MSNKFTCPPQASGQGSFSDNLVGFQLVDGGGFTQGNFQFTSSLSEKQDRNFEIGSFSDPISLDTMNLSNDLQSRMIVANNFQIYPNYDLSEITNTTIYGSLKLRFSNSIQRIINYFPAALEVNKFRPGYVEGNTAQNIIYDSVTSLWKNESLSTAGIQPTLVSATNIKTINGTSLLGSGDITVGGGITVGTTAVTSGTIGRIFFEGTGNVVQQSASLFWDNTNARLGIGATPSTTVRLDVRAQGALSTDIAFRVRNSADTANILTVNGDGSQAWLDPANNAFTTIRSGASTLIQWGNTNFLSIGIGHGHTMTGTDSYNVLIGGGATISSGTGEAIKIGVFGVSTGVGTINIGYSGRVNGSYAIKIGRHTGVSSFGGTNSIHLGRTVSGNDIAADNVFMTYFNSQSSSTLTRANGSFGLLGQQAYILGNGTGIYGTDTFMGNGGNTLVIRNHPNIPSTNITDSFQQYSSDIVAGNAAPHFRTENGNIIKLYQQSSSGITTVAQLVTVLQNLGLLS